MGNAVALDRSDSNWVASLGVASSRTTLKSRFSFPNESGHFSHKRSGLRQPFTSSGAYDSGEPVCKGGNLVGSPQYSRREVPPDPAPARSDSIT
jgi:hypothetical protein